MIRDRKPSTPCSTASRRFVRERLVPAEDEVAETDEIPPDIVARDEGRWACSA